MGSCASFFGLLLIATILSYRSIIWTLFDLVRPGIPEANISLVFLTMLAVFVLIPSAGISGSPSRPDDTPSPGC